MTNSADQSDSHANLVAAATWARLVLSRVGNEGSILEEIEAGEWSERLSEEQAADLASLLDAMSEKVRHTRALAGEIDVQGDHAQDGLGGIPALESRLPLNRKERYYTGTVLPMIVAGDGFAYLDRLLALCGLPSAGLEGNLLEGAHPISFFTEYNFAESRFTSEDKARFPGAPTEADTPDVVIAGSDWLLCIEAKVFHNPSASALNDQMRRQKVLVDYWTTALALDPAKVAHVLLLPQGLDTTGVTYLVVTWERLLQAYRVVGPRYWVSVLATALDRYNDLVSVDDTYGLNAEEHLTGQQIKNGGVKNGVTYLFMGRKGGLDGPLLAADLTSGKWTTQKYEVATADPGNSNWFPVTAFLARL